MAKKQKKKSKSSSKPDKEKAKIRALWNKQGIDHDEETFISNDENEVTLRYLRLSSLKDKKLPCVYYIHGGGMAFGSAYDPHISRTFSSFYFFKNHLIIVECSCFRPFNGTFW